MTKTEAKSSAPPPRKVKPGLVVDIGKKVDIHGLKGASQYNGMEGRITAGPNEKNRWLVQLIYQGGMKELALLAENLTPKPPCGWEVVAAGLSSHVTEEDLTRVFSKFGPVQNAKVTRDLNGLSKGVALIVMCNKESAEKALSAVEVDVCGVGVKLQWSTMVKQEMGLLKNRDEEGLSAGAQLPPASSRRTFQEERRDNAEAASAAACPFRVGQSVLVSGLKSAPQYNGAKGVVQGVRGDGRCEVLLAVGEEARTLALKVESLSAADEGDAEPSAASEGRRRFQEAGSAAAKAPDRPAAASAAGEPEEPRRRRRKSAWGENEGGEVYVGTGSQAAAAAGAPTSHAPAASAPPPAPAETSREQLPLPSAAELDGMSAGALRRLLESHKVDLSGCIEKGDYLAKARELLRC